jgi:hypothetical protein
MTGSTGTSDQRTLTLQQYVADVLALETHIEEALDGQLRLAELQDHPAALAALRRFHDLVKRQRESVRTHLNRLGGPPGGGLMGVSQAMVKNAVTTAAGMAAGAINTVRTQAVSKALRDDYTAFNHATVSYAMLLTTAQLLHDQQTLDLAAQHLQAYEGTLEEIAGVMPEVVAWELRKDGLLLEDKDVGAAAQLLGRTWRTGSHEERDSSTSQPQAR